MEDEYADYRITIDPSQRVGLTFRQEYKSPNEKQISYQHSNTAKKALFFTYSAENKVCVLLRYVFQLCLRSIQKALSHKASRTDCNLCLIHVLTNSTRIILHTQKYFDTYALMGFEMVEKSITYIIKSGTEHTKQRDQNICKQLVIESLKHHVYYK